MEICKQNLEFSRNEILAGDCVNDYAWKIDGSNISSNGFMVHLLFFTEVISNFRKPLTEQYLTGGFLAGKIQVFFNSFSQKNGLLSFLSLLSLLSLMLLRSCVSFPS